MRDAGSGDTILGWPWWCALLLAASFAVSLGSLRRPLNTHEIYVAQTAREMLTRNDWVFPTYNGEPRLNKPPLMYWAVMSAAAMVTPPGARIPEWVAGLPSALAGTFLVGATILIGGAVFTRGVGLAAGAMVGSTLGFYRYAPSARPEMLYAALSALMLAAFLCAWKNDGQRASQWGWSSLGWAGFGFAILTKGPQMPLCLLAGFLIWPLGRGQWGRLRRTLRPLSGVAIASAIVLPWVWLITARHPDVAAFWMRDLFEGRRAEAGASAWRFLSLYYLYALPGLMLPWAVLLPFGLAAPFQRNRKDLGIGHLLLCPALVAMLVMGLSIHRRDYYLLALLPPLAVLMARGFEDFLGSRVRAKTAARIGVALAAGSVIACVAAGGLLTVADQRQGWPWAQDVVGVAAAMVAGVVALVLHPRPGADRLHGVRVAALCLMVFFAAAGSSRTLAGGTRIRAWEFIDAVAQQLRGGPVIIYRVEAADLIYRLGAPLPNLRDPSELRAALASQGETEVTFILTSERALHDIQAELGGAVVLRQDMTGSDNAPRMLVKLERK